MNYTEFDTHIELSAYDAFVSLGNKCPTQMILKKIGVYKESYPFDSIPTYPGIINKYLEDNTDYFPQKNVVRNTDNIWFGHFNLNDKYEDTIAQFKRRFERLHSVINQNKRLLFIYSSEADIYNEMGNRYRSNYTDICKIRDTLLNKYSYNNFTILAIHMNKTYTNTDNIYNYTINVPDIYLSDKMETHTIPVTTEYRTILESLLRKIFSLEPAK
jgi:hypothetical protein